MTNGIERLKHCMFAHARDRKRETDTAIAGERHEVFRRYNEASQLICPDDRRILFDHLNTELHGLDERSRCAVEEYKKRIQAIRDHTDSSFEEPEDMLGWL